MSYLTDNEMNDTVESWIDFLAGGGHDRSHDSHDMRNNQMRRLSPDDFPYMTNRKANVEPYDMELCREPDLLDDRYSSPSLSDTQSTNPLNMEFYEPGPHTADPYRREPNDMDNGQSYNRTESPHGFYESRPYTANPFRREPNDTFYGQSYNRFESPVGPSQPNLERYPEYDRRNSSRYDYSKMSHTQDYDRRNQDFDVNHENRDSRYSFERHTEHYDYGNSGRYEYRRMSNTPDDVKRSINFNTTHGDRDTRQNFNEFTGRALPSFNPHTPLPRSYTNPDPGPPWASETREPYGRNYLSPAHEQNVSGTYHTPKTPGSTGKLPGNNDTSNVNSLNNDMHMLNLLVEHQQRNLLPQSSISRFNGLDFTSYLPWRRSVECKVFSRTNIPAERLQYLEEFTDLAPREIIRSCLHLPPQEGFSRAMQLLDRKYGSPFALCQAFISKLESWPTVKADDVKGLGDYSVFLTSCANTMLTVPGLNELNYGSCLRLAANKLPSHLYHRWTRIAEEIMERGETVTFARIEQFVEKSYRIASNPIFGKIPEMNRSSPKPSSHELSASGSSFRSKPFVKAAAAVNKPPDAFNNPCAFCEGRNHCLADCNKFKKMIHKERVSFLRTSSLCFGCLQPSGPSHMVSNCPKRLSCDICNGNHPTILHFNKSLTSEQASNTSIIRSENLENTPNKAGEAAEVEVSAIGSATKANGAGTMNIIPVYVRLHELGPEVLTYAFNDPGCSKVFITPKLSKEIGCKGGQIRKLFVQGMLQGKATHSRAVKNILIRGYGAPKSRSVRIPEALTWDTIPVSRVDVPTPEDLQAWPHLSEVHLHPLMNLEIGLVIGNNLPAATEPIETKTGPPGSGLPYASNTALGWQIHGNLREEEASQKVSIFCALVTENELFKFFNRDFIDAPIHSEAKGLSVEDKAFLNIMDKSTQKIEGKYHIALPLRPGAILPNNRKVAENRLKGVERKFTDPEFKEKYKEFIENLINKGYASIVPEEQEEDDAQTGRVWYLPHHGVFHPRKCKIRVVFDGGATYMGKSLNQALLQGPDLLNSLFGILMRWRQFSVAIMADLESMFYKVKVPEEDRNLLRFLWWPGGDTSKSPKVHRMNAHIFGAVSSPSVCLYALNRIAADNKDKYSDEALRCLRRHFYMDDLLKSTKSTFNTPYLVRELIDLCAEGDQRLRQWSSNSKEVLMTIPESERAPAINLVDLEKDDIPVERALGVYWNPQTDMLGFKVEIKEKPFTRRGVYSTVMSVFDRPGLAAPLILNGKKIMQRLSAKKIGWDEPLPAEELKLWKEWLAEIPLLNSFQLPRCLIPAAFEEAATIQLHHFSDASDEGYGTVTYLRAINDQGDIHCILVTARARVAPLKQVTIPRLELTAATVAVGVDEVLRNELDITFDSFFWTDSTSVLGYIYNESARFQVFVANRIQRIREASSPAQWHYVPTSLNPADEASRGQSASDFLNNHRWRFGPDFLNESESNWPERPKNTSINKDDPEVKAEVLMCAAYTAESDSRGAILEYFSDWFRLRRFLALMIRCAKGFRHKKNKALGTDPRKLPISNLLMLKAENVAIKWAQESAFVNERKVLMKMNARLPQNNPLASLNPFLLNDIIRVGGRLANADITDESKHPIILPRSSPIAKLIVEWNHKQLGHTGREHVLSKIRERFWIISAPSLVKTIIKSCTRCRLLYATPMQQIMSDLPADRVTPDEAPFTRVGIDYFGPLIVKRGRSEVKRYGALFTCLQIRAVHIEMADSLETDTFINALRRFISRRGQVKLIRSDNGSNFVGAEKEMKEALKAWNDNASEFLQQKEIEWKFNPPGASHHGGVWERLIRSARKILLNLANSQTLTDDSLRTLLAEAESIMNSRPLTRVSTDPNDLRCITPNDLLLLKNHGTVAPGLFDVADNYVRRRWRQVQYLADQFWKRWTKEYLPLLQTRQKWIQPHRNLQVNDVVLLVDPTLPRGLWPLARVEEVYPDTEGRVRSAKVTTRSSTLIRPISKMCMILETDGKAEDNGED